MSGSCSSSPTNCCSSRKMAVDLLYIDRDVCTRCRGTDEALDAALADAIPVLRAMNVEVEVRRILVETEDMARTVCLSTSPTIRINGRDIQPEVTETTCESCGTLVASGDVECRMWTWQGQQYPSPPKGLIVEALMRAAVTAEAPEAEPEQIFGLPENLVKFFANKASNTAGSGCC